MSAALRAGVARRRRAARLAFAMVALSAVARAGDGGAPAASPPSRGERDLVARHRDRLLVSASSTWPGWPVSNAVDGNAYTSWFSNRDDAAVLGKSPWLQVEFPVPVVIHGVEVWGNRDPAWATGYAVRLARLELFDERDQPLWSSQNEGSTRESDMLFNVKPEVARVRRLRVTSLFDEGNKNPYGDVAIAELKAW